MLLAEWLIVGRQWRPNLTLENNLEKMQNIRELCRPLLRLSITLENQRRRAIGGIMERFVNDERTGEQMTQYERLAYSPCNLCVNPWQT
jgi:hypothetical protein